MAALVAMQSCTDDESTYGIDHTSIVINGIDSKYDVISFAGKHLQINPTVNSTFPESDLEYRWYMYNPNKGNLAGKDTAEVISTDRNLDMEAKLLDGKYSFYYEVASKSTGYSQRSDIFEVTSASILSKGFYVLKENTEGNTDVDLYSTSENTLYADLLATRSTGALKGKPRALDIIPYLCYVNPDDGENAGGTCLSITTESDKVKWYRILDMTPIKDETNCTYDNKTDRKPYRTVYGDMSIYYFAGDGVYSAYNYSIMPSIGAFGTFGDTGSSIHIATAPSTMHCMVYWNETTKMFSFVDYNGSYFPTTDENFMPLGSYNLECIKALASYAGGETCCFLMKDPATGNRQLYFFSVGYGGANLTEVRDIDPALHAANANLIAVNGQQATIMYCIDNNRLYAYDLGGVNPERELPLQGIPANEQITYIANRWFNAGDTWDYLFIGTQSGDTYKVYMYEMVGGEPVGQPVKTISGKGKLRKVDYADPEITYPDITPLLDD